MEYKYTSFIRSGFDRIFSWKYLNLIWSELKSCPFCNGCWAGFFVYLTFCFDFSHFSARQIIEFALFSYLAGFVSLVLETIWVPFLEKYEEKKGKEFSEVS